MNKKPNLLIVSIVWTLAIWANSLLPGEISSQQSGFFSSFIYNALQLLGINMEIGTLSYIIRKSAHFMQFFILGVLWTLYFINRYPLDLSRIRYAVIIGLVVAVIDETIQIFIPGRAFMITDILIDWFGLIIGVLIASWIYLKIKNKPVEA